jgi:hypothetical protein
MRKSSRVERVCTLEIASVTQRCPFLYRLHLRPILKKPFRTFSFREFHAHALLFWMKWQEFVSMLSS